ncbi:DUF2141 domain-containing protein [Aquimarina sp. AU58]|uniref:DUF2141 domain-containing protein n=1 Tax=Aquimarina sp. AU58 TaxID=1874112 RepID=UPI000D6E4AD7|nr:DUF2141 domain-containing protein [Aquimarina sp. AU58]
MITKSLFFAVSLFLGILSINSTGQILVKVKGIKNYKGYIQVDIYKTNKGFPTSEEFAFKKLRFKVQKGENDLIINNLQHGTYAIAIYHDENSNEKLDTNFIGIPKEKTGVSNNPNSRSIPSFSDARFDFFSSKKVLEINIK